MLATTAAATTDRQALHATATLTLTGDDRTRLSTARILMLAIPQDARRHVSAIGADRALADACQVVARIDCGIVRATIGRRRVIYLLTQGGTPDGECSCGAHIRWAPCRHWAAVGIAMPHVRWGRTCAVNLVGYYYDPPLDTWSA